MCWAAYLIARERGRSVPASRVAISAHAGDRAATIETYRNAAATGADYVELDIRRTAARQGPS